MAIDARSEEEDIVFWVISHLFYETLSQVVLSEFVFGFLILGIAPSRVGTVWLLCHHAPEEDIRIFAILVGLDDVAVIENLRLSIGLLESNSRRKYFFILDELDDATTLHEDIFF